MLKRFIKNSVIILLSAQCLANPIKEGKWRGVLVLDQEKDILLPFNFDVSVVNKTPIIVIKNAAERITLNEIEQKGDSLNFKMPVFDSEFKTIDYGDSLVGVWINYARQQNNRIAFKAYHNQSERFVLSKPIDNGIVGNKNNSPDGKWEVTFSPSSKDSSKAIGIFNLHGALLSGTFLTETGDYRYLEGVYADEKLYLSCFDGSHAFLFTAKIVDNKIVDGDFYSGSSWHEKWVGERNPNFELEDPEKITRLKNDLDKIQFTFPSLSGQMVSLKDKQFKNKVVIVQLMGSWCPNCMDETAYLAQLYASNKNKGLEIIALAYERASDPERAKNNVKRLKEKYNAGYTFLITGLTGKDKAGESMPVLNKISAFPTTLYIDKKGKVRKIYTGFSGPATGVAFEKFKQQTENFIANLLKE